MMMSHYIADVRGLDRVGLQQDLALGRAAETAPEGYGANLITPQTIALWAYRHVKRIRFPAHGEKLQELDRDRRSIGFARNMHMVLDVEHPTAGGLHWNRTVTVIARCTLGAREYAHALHASAELFPKRHDGLIQSVRGLMTKLVRDALESSYDIAPENDDSAVGLNDVSPVDDLVFLPGAERRSIRDARTMERFGWYGSGITKPDLRSVITEAGVPDEPTPMQRTMAGAVWGVQPKVGDHKTRIDVGLDLSQPQRLGEFVLDGPPASKTEAELRELARKLGVSFDLLRSIARMGEHFDASLRGMQRLAEQMRPHLASIGKAVDSWNQRAFDSLRDIPPLVLPVPRCSDALDQFVDVEKQIRMDPGAYEQFSCGPGCSGAPDCACPSCVAKDEAIVEKLQHRLAADTARRINGTEGPRLLIRPRDVARFEGWGDYAARLQLTRPSDVTDELWQHALEILAGERPDSPP